MIQKLKYEATRVGWTMVQAGAGALAAVALPVPTSLKALAGVGVATLVAFLKAQAKRHLDPAAP